MGLSNPKAVVSLYRSSWCTVFNNSKPRMRCGVDADERGSGSHLELAPCSHRRGTSPVSRTDTTKQQTILAVSYNREDTGWYGLIQAGRKREFSSLIRRGAPTAIASPISPTCVRPRYGRRNDSRETIHFAAADIRTRRPRQRLKKVGRCVQRWFWPSRI
eukprot:984492-Prorocentrum_minimum.AAC.2